MTARFAKPATAQALRWTMAAALALGLAACHKADTANDQQALASNGASNGGLPGLPQAVPMTTDGTGTPGLAPLSLAPAVSRLPASAPVRIGHLPRRDDSYAYLDRAWYFDDSLDRAPPDYGFDYDGVRPWGWDYADGGRVLVEPVADGWRRYYYGPDADTPFFVSDPAYSYAFDGGMLVGMFGASGDPLELVPDTPAYYNASRYWSRGRSLAMADVPSRRYGVAAPLWAAYQPRVYDARRAWLDNVQRSGQWRAYHDRNQREAQAFWQTRREQRQVAAQRFASWQGDRFAGPAPQFYEARPERHDSGRGQALALAGGAAGGALAAGAIAGYPHWPQAHDRAAGMVPGGPANGPDRPGWFHPGNRPDGRQIAMQQQQADRARQQAEQARRQADQQRQTAFVRQQQAAGQRQALMMRQQQQAAQQRNVVLAQHQQQVAQQRQVQMAERPQARVAQRQQQVAQQRQAQMAERQQQMAQQRQAQMAERQQARVAERQQQMAQQRQAQMAERQQARVAERQQQMAQQRQAQMVQRQSARREAAMADHGADHGADRGHGPHGAR